MLKLWIELVVLGRGGKARPSCSATRWHSATAGLSPRAGSIVTGIRAEYQAFYRGRSVMITGGLGFIGSNLARQLVDLGARVC